MTFYVTSSTWRLRFDAAFDEHFETIRDATKSLSYATACIGDVVPTLTSTVFAIKDVAVPSDAARLRRYLVESLSMRFRFLLAYDSDSPFDGLQRFTNFESNEFVVDAFLNPRFCGSMDSCHEYG